MMLAASVDTNVLVRLITEDDEHQTQLVHRLVAKHAKRGDLLFVAITLVLELEWVLRARYKQSKAQVITVLSALLQTAEFSFESEAALEHALAEYEDGVADFGEYLHLALARQQSALPFLTFDRKAAKAKGVELLA